MTRRVKDIILSHFTMPAHEDGGWAMPGGGRIEDHDQALCFARAWNKLMERLNKAGARR